MPSALEVGEHIQASAAVGTVVLRSGIAVRVIVILAPAAAMAGVTPAEFTRG